MQAIVKGRETGGGGRGNKKKTCGFPIKLPKIIYTTKIYRFTKLIKHNENNRKLISGRTLGYA